MRATHPTFPANILLHHHAAGSFRGRSADFLWMLLFGGSLLTALAPFVAIEFLGSSLTFMMVYVWGRRHQYVNLSFLGIFNFTAPYLPWVLLAFSVMLGSSPKVDLLGMVAGEWQGDGNFCS
jgi:Derlin-2/3